MNWIKRHKIIVFLIGIFVILGVILSLSYYFAGQNTFIGRSANKIVNAISKPFAVSTRFVENKKTDIADILSLKEENERLRAENLKLKSENRDLRLVHRDLAELKELAELLEFEAISTDYDVVAANIISIDRANDFSMFTIDRGIDAGIKDGMVVACADGLVGRIYEAGDNSSKVISLMDENYNVSFSVMRDMGLIGIVHGDGSGLIEGFMLDSSANIAVGDKIVTSQMGEYPIGLEIGKVKSVHYDKDTRLKTVKVKPGVKFTKLQKVAVLK